VARSQIKPEQPRLRVVVGGSEAAPLPPSDDELIDAFERGDRDVAELLYDRLSGAVDATLIKVFGKRDQDHDDLVQAAFEQVLVTLARRRFARACSLKSWAISITTNVALNALRKRRSERRHVDQEQDSEQLLVTSKSVDPERGAQLAALREELGRISPTTAQVVLLHEVMGCGLAEVAALTGLSLAAAQSRLVRGRDELRRRLEACKPGVLS
jgi:RNA polymerase sigma-70 factor (ECF subfamily)